MNDSMAPSRQAYEDLVALWSRAHRLGHLQSIASWDQAANMPVGGNEARAAAMAEMAVLMHGLLTAPELAAKHHLADGASLSQQERANLDEMKRHWTTSTAVDPDLVREIELATTRCEHAWRSQRPANDWKGFLPNLE